MYAFYCLYDAKVGLVIAWVYFLASLPRKSMEWFLSDLQPCTLAPFVLTVVNTICRQKVNVAREMGEVLLGKG